MSNMLNDLNEIKSLIQEINHDRKIELLSTVDYLKSISIASQQQPVEDYTSVVIDIDDNDLLVLAKQAHERDMKLNDLFIEIFNDYLEEMKNK